MCISQGQSGPTWPLVEDPDPDPDPLQPLANTSKTYEAIWHALKMSYLLYVISQISLFTDKIKFEISPTS